MFLQEKVCVFLKQLGSTVQNWALL